MKSDILLAGLVGLFVAMLLIAVKLTDNIEKLSSVPYLEYSPIAFPILFALGMMVSRLIGNSIPVVIQSTKFLVVGALNTFIDIAILNILIAASGIADGIGFSFFKGLSFIAAVINSYLWNKFWTFGLSRTEPNDMKHDGKQFAQFLTVASSGFLVNVGSASLIVNGLGPQFGISESTWPTIGALAGTVLVLTWNFLGYKLLVFKQ